jgi:hypothetical protein
MNVKPSLVVVASSNTASGNAGSLPLLDELPNELKCIEDALSGVGNLLETRELSQFTFERLRAKFCQEQHTIKILHYCGHSTSKGLTVREEGRDYLVSPEELKAIVKLQPNLKLIFLNGCYTEDIAIQLVETGVPAVIGTTKELGDAAARGFAAYFYERLAERNTIRQAFLFTKEYFKRPSNAHFDNTTSYRGPDIPNTSSMSAWHLYTTNEAAGAHRIVPQHMLDKIREAGRGTRKVLCVYDPGDPISRATYIKLKHELFDAPNLLLYSLKEDCNKMPRAESATLIQQSDVALYFTSSGLKYMLQTDEDIGGWVISHLKLVKKQITLACNADDNLGYLKKEGLVSEQSTVLPEILLTIRLSKDKMLDMLGTLPFRASFLKAVELSKLEGLLKNALPKLNYKAQKMALKEITKNSTCYLVTIDGTKDCGQEILINHIFINRLNIPSNVTRRRWLFEAGRPKEHQLTGEMIKNLIQQSLKMGPFERSDFFNSLDQRLNEQDVVIILEEEDASKRNAFKNAVMGFWKALLTHRQQKDKPRCSFFLLAVYRGAQEPGEQGCFVSTIPKSNNEAAYSNALPVIDPIDEDDLDIWVADHIDDYHSRIKLNDRKAYIVEQRFMKKAIETICRTLDEKRVLKDLFTIKYVGE